MLCVRDGARYCPCTIAFYRVLETRKWTCRDLEILPEVPELIGGRAKKGNCLQHLCSLQNRKKTCQSHRERARRSLYQRQGSSLSSEGSVRWETHGTGRRVVGWVCPCVSKEPQSWGASGRTRLWKTVRCCHESCGESFPWVTVDPPGYYGALRNLSL